MNKIKIIALFGMSGAGKDSIQHWLVNKIHGHKIVSYTTRPKRDYEINGKDYHFIDMNTFNQLIKEGKMLEYTFFNGWLYGTCINDLKENEINIGVFNLNGIKTLTKEYNSQLEVLPVFIHAYDRTRLMRNLNREKNPNYNEICRRFLADYEDLSCYFKISSQFKNNLENIEVNSFPDFEVYLNEAEDFSGILNRPKLKAFIFGQK